MSTCKYGHSYKHQLDLLVVAYDVGHDSVPTFIRNTGLSCATDWCEAYQIIYAA